MSSLRKRLLIVDDSVIDREILKNILQDNFEIMETDNGYNALEIISKNIPHIDAVLLDISMPVLDGFNVLRLMKENGIDKTPVILITSEATKENVQKSSQYSNVSHFISKPFNAGVILPRLLTMFNIDASGASTPEKDSYLSKSNTEEISQYIEALRELFKACLINRGMDDSRYIRTSDLMEIVLKEYSRSSDAAGLDNNNIMLISQAAYFYDIGSILIPYNLMEEKNLTSNDRVLYESHTSLGARLVQLNTSPSCSHFIKICEDMCLHHHERFDGEGFPNGLKGQNNYFYTQLCRLISEFDSIFISRKSFNEYQFDFVLKEITIDSGIFDPKAIDLLIKCKESVILYYSSSSSDIFNNIF